MNYVIASSFFILIFFVSFERVWAAPIACKGASSGGVGTCSTIANCAGTIEPAQMKESPGLPAAPACPDQEICCVKTASGNVNPSGGGGKSPIVTPGPPANSGGGNQNPGTPNQGANCTVPTGGTGQCVFTSQCNAANQVPTSSCFGGTVCCVLSNSGQGGGGGGSSCAGGNGTCTTISDCSGSPITDPTACGGGLICCPDTGSGTGGTTTAVGNLNCASGYQKVAGVCFPVGTGLSEKSVLDIIAALVSWLLAIFGFIALLGFVISGIQYLLSTGDEGMAETAKRNMKYSIIGIIVALSGWIIIKAVDALLNASSLI